ncbi:MAG: glycosyltransferase [Fimbriimonadales bacterium]|nr:glycosyltransferase [Fimbriimonadales bacterium]
MVRGRASVIVPCFNASGTLRQAIDSALAQTHADTEVVVVDDGSTDGSAAIAASYGERVVLVRQPNRGLSAARNAGVAESSGEFLTLLDADDALMPECVARRVAVLLRHPEVGLVAGYYREIDAEGRLRERVPEQRRVGPLPPFRQAVRRNWGPPVGWTFRREAFERCGGFDPLLRSCEDWDFVIRVASRYAIAYDPEPHALYRISPGQMSSNFERMLDAARRVRLKNAAYAEHPWLYRWDALWGQFELGRRILFASLFQSGPGGGRRTAALVARHPHLLWVGVLSALSYLAGKRPSSGGRRG